MRGYEAPQAILSLPAAEALKIAADILKKQGFSLKIFDAYRPQRAVDHFVQWAQDLHDQKMKDKFYPEINKKDLFSLGYLAKRSGHSRASVVDLTLLYLETREEVDMGSFFDYFGSISHHDTDLINKEQTRNRQILRDAMVEAGFLPYYAEWWHYQLKNEPYPNTYFDFVIEEKK